MTSIPKRNLWITMPVIIAALGIFIYGCHGPVDDWAMLDRADGKQSLIIQHPYSGALFPANAARPVALWNTNAPGVNRWLVGIKAGGERWLYRDIKSPWHLPAADWQKIKQTALPGSVEFIVAGYQEREPKVMLVKGTVLVQVVSERVDTPLFFREVILPFKDAVKDPSRIRWRFGGIEREEPPPVVLENLPVCGNCHSFSRNGEYMAMDVDYANSKASYIITRTAPEIRLNTSDIITWDDFSKADGQTTFGLLSQISPDGRYVLSTVKDRSVFVPKPDLAFSQLFFPLKGLIAVYDREQKNFFSLPGADDPAYVQSNPTWSPDGKWIVFARNFAYELRNPKVQGKIILSPEECEEFLKDGKDFRYDLYRIPFNAGKGGKPEPLRGASGNGRSNYFPKYSPDGRWIIFCQANNYMLLQPDSELFIIPAEGGESRRLACNMGRMNSWHSWSPDSQWLVFSSKVHSPYTQLYLTRINEQGEASPPVWLDRMVGPNRAANIPEFVALPQNAIVKIKEEFLDDYSFTRAGNEFYKAGDADAAIEKYQKALSMNSNNAMAHQRLGFLMFQVKKKYQEGILHTREAIRLEPNNALARYDLGMDLMFQGDLSNAVPHLAMASALMPEGYDSQYNATDINYHWGHALFRLGQYTECVKAMEKVLRFATNHAEANFMLAMSMAYQGATDISLPFYQRALTNKPSLSRLPDFYDLLSWNYLQKGEIEAALETSEKARKLALDAGRQDQAAKLQKRIEECRAALKNRSSTGPLKNGASDR